MKRFIVLLLVCCLGAAVTARPIRGTVKCAGTPVSGVTVTDGHSFTESGADGTFTLDADDDALFISIVTPSGYLAPMEQDIPQFFRPYAASTKRYDFELRPWPATGEVYELLAIGDPQPKTAAHFDRLRTEIIPELQRATALGKQRGTAQAALLLGDIVWDSPELFAGVREQFASLGIPVYGVIGNHDHDLKKYTLRLLLFALLSEVPFDLMYGGTWFYPVHQNVIWTLLLGLLGVHLMETVRKKQKLWVSLPVCAAVAAAGALLGTLGMTDYYGAGVLTVFAFYAFRGRKWWCLLGQVLTLYWINVVLLGGLMYPIRLFGMEFELCQQGLALLALVPIWLYRGRQGCHSKPFQYACYAFYPVHMLLLVLALNFVNR